MGSESETTVGSAETFSTLTWPEGTGRLPMLVPETDVTGDRPENQSHLIASSRLDLVYFLCVSFIVGIFAKLELRKSALPLAEFGRSEAVPIPSGIYVQLRRNPHQLLHADCATFCKGLSSAPMKPIRILIADDHAVVLEGLVALIGRQSDMEIVAQASNGKEAVEEWNNHRPDVSLLDLRMPALDAVGVITRIRETDPAARVLVLTTFDTDEDIYRAVKSGAKGYLLKDAPRDILLESIRKVHAGETCLAPELTAKLAGRLSSASLTDRELDVLALLVRGKSTREIGAALFIGETTVKSHLKKMSGKLGVIGRAEIISESLRRGLVRL
jgi:DNA-binding NarL/FixJ family response regulator